MRAYVFFLRYKMATNEGAEDHTIGSNSRSQVPHSPSRDKDFSSVWITQIKRYPRVILFLYSTTRELHFLSHMIDSFCNVTFTSAEHLAGRSNTRRRASHSRCPLSTFHRRNRRYFWRFWRHAKFPHEAWLREISLHRDYHPRRFVRYTLRSRSDLLITVCKRFHTQFSHSCRSVFRILLIILISLLWTNNQPHKRLDSCRSVHR